MACSPGRAGAPLFARHRKLSSGLELGYPVGLDAPRLGLVQPRRGPRRSSDPGDPPCFAGTEPIALGHALSCLGRHPDRGGANDRAQREPDIESAARLTDDLRDPLWPVTGRLFRFSVCLGFIMFCLRRVAGYMVTLAARLLAYWHLDVIHRG